MTSKPRATDPRRRKIQDAHAVLMQAYLEDERAGNPPDTIPRDDEYLFAQKVLSKSRRSITKLNHHVSRAEFSVRVQADKLKEKQDRVTELKRQLLIREQQVADSEATVNSKRADFVVRMYKAEMESSG